jgi:hypothetical protein
MTTSRDPDFLIEAFLHEGINELPDRSFDVVRDSIERTRQRVVFGPWREDQMNKLVAFGLAAAAVVLVAVIGSQFIQGNLPAPAGSPAPTATLSPTASPTPTADDSPAPTDTAMALPAEGELAAGRYAVSDEGETRVPLSFSVPSGWTTSEGIVRKGPEGTKVEVAFSPFVVDHVYRDACRWEGTATAVNTAAEIMAALGGQTGREVGPIADVVIDGYSGQQIRLFVPNDADLSDCTWEFIHTWPLPGGDDAGGWGAQPGQTDMISVVDVHGEALVVVTSYQQFSVPGDLAELRSIFDSIDIAP